MFKVYVIGKSEDIVHPYVNCYVGVTNNLKHRWRGHVKSPYTVGEYIRKHDLKFKDMHVIFTGSSEECFEIEQNLRPIPLIGLNEAVGGRGGYTSYTAESSRKKSLAIKASRKIKPMTTWAHKIVENRRTYDGDQNPNAKKWVAISPSGKRHNITTSLEKFCFEKELLLRPLRGNIGKEVPPPTTGYGGFRAKNEEQRKMRNNTTGWKLVMENSK
jgi:predicted GIY-YIG superfamily endonuclease